MSINLNAANNQANQLLSQINSLNQAKKQLLAYNSSITSNWSGTEVKYVSKSIEQTIKQIDAVINQLKSLSSSIKSTAAAIKREEDEAAARARARATAKARMIEKAQNEYDKAVENYENKMNEYISLKAAYEKRKIFKNGSGQEELKAKLEEMLKELKKNKDLVDSKKTALENAKK